MVPEDISDTVGKGIDQALTGFGLWGKTEEKRREESLSKQEPTFKEQTFKEPTFKEQMFKEPTFKEAQQQAMDNDKITNEKTHSPVLTPFYQPKGFNKDFDFYSFKEAIAKKESGGVYNIVGGSSDKFTGKYQMGVSALIDSGLMKEGSKDVNDPSQWLLPGGREAFLNNPAVQEKAYASYIEKMRNYTSHSLNKYGVDFDRLSTEDQAGVVASAHLTGQDSAARLFVEGKTDEDAFGTKNSEYFKIAKESQQSPVFVRKEVEEKKPQPADKNPLNTLLEQQTFTGIVPKPLDIPQIVDPEKTLSVRENQNLQLKNNPQVQTVLNALEASGSPMADSKDVIETLRLNGAIPSILSNNLEAISRIDPSLTTNPGFVQMLHNADSKMSSQMINPVRSMVGDVLETSTDNAKKQEQTTPSISVQNQGRQERATPQINSGVQTPLTIRNTESSLRRLTDSLLGMSMS